MTLVLCFERWERIASIAMSVFPLAVGIVIKKFFLSSNSPAFTDCSCGSNNSSYPSDLRKSITLGSRSSLLTFVLCYNDQVLTHK